MDRARFLRVKDLFRRALPLDARARSELLEAECDADVTLRAEVQELLAHAAAAEHDFLHGDPRPPPCSTPPPGVEIEGFRVLEPLASGGSGVVYRAEQLAPRREVAIKILRMDALTSGAATRFAREAEVLGSLRHPGIAAVYGAGVARSGSLDLPWIAMELVRGIPLNEYAAARRHAPRVLLELFTAVCAAVEHAHLRGVVHRDLKPSNVLVEDDGRPRVLDFGVARIVGQDVGEARTHTGALIGTLAYMAPEQARGERDAIDVRSDVYALGVVLFEMLTGKLPVDVDRGDVLEAVRAVCEDDPERLSRARPGLPRDLDAVVARALEKQRGQRYPDVGALARDVGNVLANRPVDARRSTVIDQARRFVRRNRVLALSAAAVIAALGAGLVVALLALRTAREERGRTAETLDYLARRMTSLGPRLGFGEEQRPELEEVAARVERQLELDPRSRPLRSALAQTLYDLASLDQARGDLASLRARAERALALRAGLVRESPLDIESRCRSSDLCAKLGEAARDSGDLAGRDAWFARALSIDEALVREHPDDAELVEDLGWSLARVGQAAAERGDLDEAERLLLRRIADAERIGSRDSHNPRLVYNLSHALYFYSGLLEKRGRPAESVPHVLEAVQLARKLCDLEPERRDFVVWRTAACRGAASILHQTGRVTEAQALALEALEAATNAAAYEPGRPLHLDLVRTVVRELLSFEGPSAQALRARARSTLEQAASVAALRGAPEAAARLRAESRELSADLDAR
ncbi:MAG: serine/threonine protein kinase [Planctomycetes bacterium]|nr:serine/threonine protein kinase [Planctomycetota bacterium]